MESKFEKSEFSCLNEVLREIRNTEQTQEIRLTDDLPDVGRILGSWAQIILRGKEWHRDAVYLSAGLQVHVLYAPEGGGEPRHLETWIPFQMNWDIPEDTPEGKIRILCLSRFVDARSTSARKIMVRTGAAAMAEILAPAAAGVYMPADLPEDVQMLRNTYPMRLPVEAGEKTFLMEEELTLPGSAPVPEKLISYRMEPEITDRKVLTDRLVFRGTARLHVLYESESAQMHTWDFELPFSQYAELEGTHSADARADIMPAVTALEVEPDDEGHMHLKAGLLGQYLISDLRMVDLTEDAYSPLRELGIRQEMLELPAVLDTRRENIYGEQTLSGEGNIAADVQFLPDFPRIHRNGENVELEIPGMLQILYYDGEGNLRSAQQRWEGKHSVKSAPENRMVVLPLPATEPQVQFSGDHMIVKIDQPLQMQVTAGRGIPMITGLELGPVQERDPDRPSLILLRAGKLGLWDVAKKTGSTVEKIKLANGLQEEPEPERMLLIPVS